MPGERNDSTSGGAARQRSALGSFPIGQTPMLARLEAAFVTPGTMTFVSRYQLEPLDEIAPLIEFQSLAASLVHKLLDGYRRVDKGNSARSKSFSA